MKGGNLMISSDQNAADDAFEIGDVDANIFTYEISDEALEAAAGSEWAAKRTISGDGSETSKCGTYNNGCC
jgi:hypothetical protein